MTKLNVPAEVSEVLGNFANALLDDWWNKYCGAVMFAPEAKQALAAYIQQECDKVARAYGGCTKCYGKGYATVRSGITGYDDFGGDGFKTSVTTKMKFCTCDRGKQLAALIHGEDNA